MAKGREQASRYREVHHRHPALLLIGFPAAERRVK
jgi:hypothetical protein